MTANSAGQSSEPKFCGQCGKSVKTWSQKFCPNCGSNLRNPSSNNVSRAKTEAHSLSGPSIVSLIAIFAVVVFLVIDVTLKFQASGISTSNNQVQQPNFQQPTVEDSYTIGVNAGKGLAAQNTSLFPNHTSMCGQVYQNYASQASDFDRFMAGCISSFH